MARDSSLPRFCGLFSRLGYTGQSCNVVPTKAVHIFVPSQHLIQKVLHFVCEFRQSFLTIEPCVKAAIFKFLDETNVDEIVRLRVCRLGCCLRNEIQKRLDAWFAWVGNLER